MSDQTPRRRSGAEGYGRPVSDPQALRALAHTGRYAILERLQTRGPATATECAEVAGLSPSACSYHLRLLARHGFVEEDTSDDARSDGRERVWRAATPGWFADPPADADPREMQAIDSTLTRVMMASSDRRVLDFVDRAAAEPEWREAALLSNSTIVATVEELADVSQALLGVLGPYFVSARSDPADRPEGARDVHVSIRMAPRPPDPGVTPAAGAAPEEA
ncbi:MAG TPA: winged helix-turn-helix domain-containing protein [Actinomycetes bacterium]|nr:winged helix-turn-helix domain-containing protein [Actinomycetes bacterium]